MNNGFGFYHAVED